ncbi:MAG: DNA polymerase III subunit gamma/tau [Saprospiraceae bacterium]|nr:DNA polymerase III subunit gamma/tau [Saprospiraceae bacterium]MDW8228414.1 DNA polymerase III subunit gamma/tau [Saprospiraceae bacterium]
MSAFVVSARKYRPLRFEDVVGQQHVARTLKNALATGHVAHAFLFCGPRGVGKTTCARILARVLNCENRTPDFEACQQCPSCLAFQDDASWNIFELDAASNNGVDHIRALVEQVRIPPQRGQYKVYIIDEVHMLSQGAFNAFLKTLEEPPPYAIFILATTEKHKILPTILSRCQVFDFRRIEVADTAAHLAKICQLEGIEADPEALRIIAQKADGALRDALSIFDRISSAAAGGPIRYQTVLENLNLLDYDYYFQITDALLAEDASAVLLLFDDILRKGFEPEIFLTGLSDHLRNLLVCRDPATLPLLEAGENLRERYQRQAQLASLSFLLTALSIANDCDVNLKTARHKRLHVEIALLKMCYILRAVPAADFVAEKKTADPSPIANAHPTASSVAAPAESAPTPAASAPTSHLAPPAKQTQAAEKPLPPSTATELSPEAMQGLRTDIRLGRKRVESIPLRLEDYDSEVAEEANRMAQLENKLSLENARAEWQAFANATPSPSLRQAMSAAELRLDGDTLTVTVGLAVHRGLIQEEINHLRDVIRENLHAPNANVRVVLDEQKAPAPEQPKPRRFLTAKEKLDQMAQANPTVLDLLKRFDLKIDE